MIYGQYIYIYIWYNPNNDDNQPLANFAPSIAPGLFSTSGPHRRHRPAQRRDQRDRLWRHRPLRPQEVWIGKRVKRTPVDFKPWENLWENGDLSKRHVDLMGYIYIYGYIANLC